MNNKVESIISREMEFIQKKDCSCETVFKIKDLNELGGLLFGLKKDNNYKNDYLNLDGYCMFTNGGLITRAGTIMGGIYHKKDVAWLGLINLTSPDYARLGIGTELLKMFETAIKEEDTHHITGHFIPVDPSISTREGTLKFYEKNGFALCENKFNNNKLEVIYKNFDNEFNPKPLSENYIESEDYPYSLYPFCSNTEGYFFD